MSTPHDPIRLDAELRDLARRLVDDVHLADDLVQDTYLAALRRPGRSPARWLRESLRLRARHRRAGERRRRRHERAAARADLGSGPERSSAERAGLLEALAEELARLGEPYRSTLERRFLRGEAPAAIARADGVPARTVYTRIARGLRRLREHMDRRCGAAWALLLLDAERRAPASPAALGAVAGVALLAGAAVLALWVGHRGEGPTDLAVAAAKGRPDLAGDARLAVPPAPRGRSAPPTEPAVATAAATRDRAGPRGRVVSLEGRPLGGLDVLLQSGTITSERDALDDFAFEVADGDVARATSAADGTWSLDDPAGTIGRLVARGERHAPVLAELWPTELADGERGLLLVAAPRRIVAGRVLASEGGPLPGVRVALRLSAERAAALDRRERTWLPVVPSARTDGAGRFELTDAFDDAGARLVVSAPGRPERTLELDPGPVSVDVVLELGEESPGPLRGTVRDDTGAPVAGAFVVAGASSTRSAADGSFELAADGLEGADVAWAVAHGRLPARAAPTVAGEELALVIGGPALAIEGTVVDARGEPLEGALVWCVDATHLGTPRNTWFAELYVDPEERWRMPFSVGTDAEGRFEIPHRIQRDYRVGAMWVPTWASTTSEPLPAGTRDAVLVVPSDDPRPPVSGVVAARDGRPLAGVRVTVAREAMEVELAPGRTFQAHLKGRSTVTDELGSFDLGPQPLRGCELQLAGDDVLPLAVPLPDREGPRELRVVVPRRARLGVHAPDAEPTDRVSVLDADGRRTRVFDAADYADSFDLGGVLAVELGVARRALLIAPDTARELVLYRGDEELRRVPLDLSAEGDNTIEL